MTDELPSEQDKIALNSECIGTKKQLLSLIQQAILVKQYCHIQKIHNRVYIASVTQHRVIATRIAVEGSQKIQRVVGKKPHYYVLGTGSNREMPCKYSWKGSRSDD